MYDLSKLDSMLKTDISSIVIETMDSILPMYEGFYGKNLTNAAKAALCLRHLWETKSNLEKANVTEYMLLERYKQRVYPFKVDTSLPIEINLYSYACLGYMCGWNKHIIKFEDLDANVLNELLPVGWSNMLPIFVCKNASGEIVPGREYAGFLEIGSYFVARGQSIDQIFTKDNFKKLLFEWASIMYYITTGVPELRLLRYHVMGEAKQFMEPIDDALDKLYNSDTATDCIRHFTKYLDADYLLMHPTVEGSREMEQRLNGIEQLRKVGRFANRSAHYDFITWVAVCLVWGRIDVGASDDMIVDAVRVIFKWSDNTSKFSGDACLRKIFYINNLNPLTNYTEFVLGESKERIIDDHRKSVGRSFPKSVVEDLDEFELSALQIYQRVLELRGESLPTFDIRSNLEKVIGAEGIWYLNKIVENYTYHESKDMRSLDRNGKIRYLINYFYKYKVRKEIHDAIPDPKPYPDIELLKEYINTEKTEGHILTSLSRYLIRQGVLEPTEIDRSIRGCTAKLLSIGDASLQDTEPWFDMFSVLENDGELKDIVLQVQCGSLNMLTIGISHCLISCGVKHTEDIKVLHSAIYSVFIYFLNNSLPPEKPSMYTIEVDPDVVISKAIQRVKDVYPSACLETLDDSEVEELCVYYLVDKSVTDLAENAHNEIDDQKVRAEKAKEERKEKERQKLQDILSFLHSRFTGENSWGEIDRIAIGRNKGDIVCLFLLWDTGSDIEEDIKEVLEGCPHYLESEFLYEDPDGWNELCIMYRARGLDGKDPSVEEGGLYDV